MDEFADQLAAAYDKKEVEPTGEKETPVEKPATQEENEAEATTKEETPAESEGEDTQAEPKEDENQLVVDDTGKKYVPEKRFKEIYAKQKEAERRAIALEQQLASKSNLKPTQPVMDRSAMLENELLFTKMPQFDPSSTEYSPILDEMAADIYQVEGGKITKLEAARRAKERATAISGATTSVKESTTVLKKDVSEAGLNSRPASRRSTAAEAPQSEAEMEAFLKSSGQW